MSRVRIASVDDLKPGSSVKFTFKKDGLSMDGFAANFQGTIVAYQNTCRHLPLTLDYADNRFFEREGKYFICQSHGALYDPLTGKCVRGPCQGASLQKLAIDIEGGVIWLKNVESESESETETGMG